MTIRREFTRDQREQIVDRSKNELGQIHCEGCGLVLAGKKYEIDHKVAEALIRDADKKRKLTIEDGQLLGECCHRGADGKTNADVKRIAKAKAQAAMKDGYGRKARPMANRPFPPTEKTAKPTTKSGLPPRPMYERPA